MWHDIAFGFCLCFLAMTPATAAAWGDGPQVLVKYTEREALIEAAFCPHDLNRNENILSVSLLQGQKELERVTSQKDTHTSPTVLKLACRRILPAPANRSPLVVAWEPTISFSLEDDALNCLTHFMPSSNTTVTATVRSYQALRRSWTVNKLRATPDSMLEIKAMVKGGDWETVFSQDDWTSSHRRANRSVQFYNLTAESDDMTILKVVDTADVFSLIMLVSQDSTLPAHSDKWKYAVKVGGVVKDNRWTSPKQTQLPSCKTKGFAYWICIVGPIFVVVSWVVSGVIYIYFRRRSRTSARARRSPPEASHYEMLEKQQDNDQLKNAVMLPSSSQTDSGGTGR